LRRVAEQSDVERGKVSCVAVCNGIQGRVLHLYAHNYRVKERSVHAEQALVAKAAKKGISLQDATVIVYRRLARPAPPKPVTRDCDSGISKPCALCRSLLKKAGVKEIIFAEAANSIYKDPWEPNRPLMIWTREKV